MADTNSTQQAQEAMNKTEQETIVSYKGFGANWKCRDFQFAVGETYTHEGEVKGCGSGFHACEHPLNVFAYYPPAGSKFALVEQSGDLSRHGEDTKVASRSITIKAEIDIPGLVRAAIEYVSSRCTPIDPKSPSSATGYQGAASATGDQGVALSAGYDGRALAAEGCAIFLVNRDNNYNIRHVFASKVGENGIKPNVWYSLDDEGKAFEADGGDE